MIDPIVEEVRLHRMEHTRKFGGDLNLICEDLRRIQRNCGRQIVRRPPKPPGSWRKTGEEARGSS